MPCFPRHCRFMLKALTPLQYVVDLESDVVNLRKPLHGHVLREKPGVATCFCEVENHVLNQWSAVDVVVFKGRTLIQEFVVLPRSATTIERLPTGLQFCLLFCIVLFALGVFDCAIQMVVVKVMLLNKGLPILVGIEPLGL